MARRPFSLIALALVSVVIWASTTGASPRIKFPGSKCHTFRIALKDKRGCGYTIDKPRQFLSHKAIERRNRFGIAIDSTDLPVSYQYLRQIGTEGLRIIGTSKWNNTVLVNCTDTMRLYNRQATAVPVAQGYREAQQVRHCHRLHRPARELPIPQADRH